MNNKKFLASFIIFGAAGALYTFTPYKTIKNVLGIGFGLRHNDHVMIGTIALIIGVVSLYAFIRRNKNKHLKR